MIAAKSATWAAIIERGDLVIPCNMVEQFGLKPGMRVHMESDTDLRVF
jgi:hypothetical protein